MTDSNHLEALHSFSMQPLHLLRTAHRDRISRFEGEQLKIETVLYSDSHDFTCKINRKGKTVSQSTFSLTVQRPDISLFPIDVGSHYVALGWNDSLSVTWTENVKLMLSVKDANNSTLRVIQLNILNPWFGYNVIRLRAEQVRYTVVIVSSL